MKIPRSKLRGMDPAFQSGNLLRTNRNVTSGDIGYRLVRLLF